MKSYKSFPALAFMVSTLFLFSWQRVAAEYFKELGPVSIRGESGHFEIFVNERLIAKDDNWYVSIEDGFPSRKNPKWLLILSSNGGNCCAPSYRIIDISQETPLLTTEFYSNSYVFTGQQVIFDAGQDIWAYDQQGLIKLPTLPLEERIQEGTDAYKRGQYARALRFLWPLRNQRNHEAPYYLGLSYLHGYGLVRDYPQAKSYFQAAADMGNTRALFQLANMYANGFGNTHPDAKLARESYLQGANLGDGACQLALSVQLATGVGGNVDLKQALFWVLLAKERLSDVKKIEVAQKQADLIEAQLSEQEVQKIRSEVYFWKPKEFSLFGSASSLLVWKGKYPFEPIKGLKFIDVPEVSVRLQAALGEEAFKTIKLMQTAPPIEEKEGWLIATGCMPHACPSSWSVLINLKTYDLFACLHEESYDPPTKTEIFGGTGFPRVNKTLQDNNGEGQCKAEKLSASAFNAILAPRTQIAKVPEKPSERYSGSGYALNRLGEILTDYHVVNGCYSLSARRDAQTASAALVAFDERNDLAIIKVNSINLTPVKFRDGKGARPGDAIVAIGYPYAGLLTSTPQTTTGTITALAGVGDDSRYVQISSPIQPGNSGGPVLDASGHVVGTVVATLNALSVAKTTGSIPQNVNFAIKSSIVRDFLDSKGINYETEPSLDSLNAADVSEIGVKSLVMVECIK